MIDKQLFEDIGHIKAMVSNVAADVQEMKIDIKENIYPSIASYSRDRNMIIGGCVAISAIMGAMFGGIGKALAKVFNG